MVSLAKEVNAIEMKNISKKFGDFTANDSINFSLREGEIHALLGENGAGKSTLMNILYGLHTPSSGEILIKGKKVEINNPNIAIKNGIGMVHQHFMLIDDFNVVENIILGMEPTKFSLLDIKKAREEVIKISELYGLDVDPDIKIEDMSVGAQQRVEILKALYRGAETLILDEPTAVLTPQEIDDLTITIRNLSKEGKNIIIITHKLREIKEMADRCTIIRRGRKVSTVDVDKVTEKELAEMMVGREINLKVEKGPYKPGKEVLEVENLVVKDNRKLNAVNHLNLVVKKGEIFGIAGIDGNGQSELIEAITGLRKIESGNVKINGIDITNKSPFEIINTGISTIPEDRHKRGLVLEFDVKENMILENYYKEPFSVKNVLRHSNIEDHASKLIEDFDIRPEDPNKTVAHLSGGNQQKVIIAREIHNNPDLLIAAQPTRGLDVGAIEYVHKYLVAQRDLGKAVLLVSFELDEILNISDRIGVIYEGEIVEILDQKDADENKIGLLMAGGGRDEEK